MLNLGEAVAFVLVTTNGTECFDGKIVALHDDYCIVEGISTRSRWYVNRERIVYRSDD